LGSTLKERTSRYTSNHRALWRLRTLSATRNTSCRATLAS